MTGPLDRHTVIYLTVTVLLLLVGVIGLFSGHPIAGVG